MSCSQCRGIRDQFDDKVARRELKRFRRSGPRRTTRRLIRFIQRSQKSYGSLLDIGGGIGSIQHELADSIDGAIVSVDASPAYVSASRSEAEKRRYIDRVSYFQTNFVDIAGDLNTADLVTLDRVICCYDNLEDLLGAAAAKAESGLGLVFPRDETYMKLATSAANWLIRQFGSEFQAYIYPHERVESILRQHGFVQTESSKGLIWRVSLFRKSA